MDDALILAPTYFPDADLLSYVTKDVPTVARHIDATLTILMDTERKEVIGAEIYAPGRAFNEWRPIESMPLDGQLRLFANAFAQVYIAPALPSPPLTHRQQADLAQAGAIQDPRYSPTHWMPLPRAP